MSLQNQIAIVTGAGTGIGEAAAKMLAADGATVVLVGRRVEPLESTKAAIESDGGTAVVMPADLTDLAAADKLAEDVLQKYGKVDVLVNNAGFSSKVRSVRYVDQDAWDAVFKVNMDAIYRLTQACLPKMIEQGQGTIIITSSMSALKPGVLGGSPYSAAKAASRAFSHGLNSELRDLGVRSTVIVPAEVNTEILDGRPSVPDEEARKTMMQPEDVAACIHLAATLPPRTVIEELVVAPTKTRDMSAELEVAKTAGAPE